MKEVTIAAAKTAGSTAVAAGAGFLTRPCCLVPAVLSLTGGSAAGLGEVAIQYRPWFTGASVIILAAPLWMNVTWHARPWNKWLAVLSTIATFLFVARRLGL